MTPLIKAEAKAAIDQRVDLSLFAAKVELNKIKNNAKNSSYSQ